MTTRTILAVLIITGAAFAEPLTHETAPRLSDKELGHLRNFVALADQDLNDFSGFEAHDQKGMEAYRYQIAFMTYALALQQYNSVPAYRDLYEHTIDRLIERMLQKPVWEFWSEVSKSSKEFDPDLEGPLPGTKDPVGEKNIMYSGHVLHMIALYEMFYHDMQWSAPDALTFRWNSDVAFKYDYPELIQRVHDEMLKPRRDGSRDIGAMECEPNLVFPECNQHPTLAFTLYDALQGTDYAETIKPVFMSFLENTAMQNPKTEHTEAFYMIHQDSTFRVPPRGSASADGWTGAFMHAWRPKYIEALYEKQRDDFMSVDESTGELKFAFDPTRELALAFFANLAVEVGDTDTAQRLFDYADRHYASESDEHGFRYSYNMGDTLYPTNNTTDKLMALARSNRPDGLWKLHNEPWTKADYGYPLLAAVDFPNVLVSQAVWDADYKTLLFTLEPLDGSVTSTTFSLKSIPDGYACDLVKDGKVIASVDDRGQAKGTGVATPEPGTVAITTSLDGPTRFTLRPK